MPVLCCSWLGDRTPSGRRIQRTPRQIVTAPVQPKPEEPDPREARTAPDRRNDKERDELGKFDFQFRTRPQPELVQRTQTLCNIFNRRNVLAGMHHKAWEEDTHSRDGDSDPRASVTFKDGNVASGASSRGVESAFDYARTTEARGIDPADYCRTVSADGMAKTGDFMKDLLVCKYRKKKRKKKPLDDRIKEFFQTCDDLKGETIAAENPPDVEVARKWTLLTKGVKAALAESSDDEDDNNMHTIWRAYWLYEQDRVQLMRHNWDMLGDELLFRWGYTGNGNLLAVWKVLCYHIVITIVRYCCLTWEM